MLREGHRAGGFGDLLRRGPPGWRRVLAAVNTDPKRGAVIIAISQRAWKRSATWARSGTISSAAGL